MQIILLLYLGISKGEEFLIDAISLNDDINGRILLSQAYRLQGKLELAQAQVNQAKELDSDNIWINEIDIELKKSTQPIWIIQQMKISIVLPAK